MRRSTHNLSHDVRTRPRVLKLELLEQRLVLATITVTTAQDTVDFNDGVTSLREAIFAANTVPGADTIKFDGSLGGQTIRLTQGELLITDDLSIVGLGTDNLTIDASGSDPTPNVKNGDGSRIFDINAWADINLPSLSVSISGLTLTGGDASYAGGAIFSTSSLQITACNIHDNAARGDGGAVFVGGNSFAPVNVAIEDSQFLHNSSATTWSYGGAISVDSSYYDGEVSIRNCDVIGNTAIASQTLDSFTGGWAWGGGVSIESIGEIDVTNNRIDANIANGTWSWGGGLYVESKGKVNISNNEFDQNVSQGTWAAGGGVAIEDDPGIPLDLSLVVAGNSVTANSASGSVADGGGLYLELHDSLLTAELSDNNIGLNSAKTGGGISLDFWQSAESVQLLRNEIDYNTAVDYGGGLYIEYMAGWGYATTEIQGSTFLGNASQDEGGGIWTSGSLLLTDSTLSKNHSDGVGGAIAGSAVLNRCTISGNTALNGGGIYGRELTIENSLVAGNTNASGPQDLAYIDPNRYYGPAPSLADLGVDYQVRYSLIGTNRGVSAVLAEAPIGVPDKNGNLIGGAAHGVIDAQLSAPIYDGGRTMIQLPLASSPVINMGDPSAVAGVDGVPQFDERGTPFLRVAYGRIDIGAAELQLRPPAIQGDYNRDSVVDGLDYILWRLNQGQQVTNFSAADGDGSGVVDSADYNAWRTHFGETATPPVALAFAAAPKNSAKTVAQSSTLKPQNIGLTSSIPHASQLLSGGVGSAPAILPAEEEEATSALCSTQNNILALLATPQVIRQSQETQAIQPIVVRANEDCSTQSLDLAFDQLSDEQLIPALTAI